MGGVLGVEQAWLLKKMIDGKCFVDLIWIELSSRDAGGELMSVR